MDPSAQTWATPRPAAGALLVGGVLLVICAIFVAPDAAGAVIMGIAGVMLLGFGTYGFVVRPRLLLRTAGSPTLTIRTIGSTTTYSPAEIERVRILNIRRIGRRSGQLEIDIVGREAGDSTSHPDGPREDNRFAVFSRWDLGADVTEVAEALENAGFTVDDSR